MVLRLQAECNDFLKLFDRPVRLVAAGRACRIFGGQPPGVALLIGEARKSTPGGRRRESNRNG